MRNYGKLCTIIYDLDKPLSSGWELENYLKYIENPKAEILEPMCGSGRFYIPLLERGYSVTGFDLSNEMLKACEERCRSLNLKPRVFQGDITEFDSEEKYDYAIIPIGSVSLLINEKELLSGLKNIHSALKPGGAFIFSFLNDSLEEEDIPDWVDAMSYPYEEMEILCKKKQTFHGDSGLLEMKLLYQLIQDGQIMEEEYQDFPMRAYGESKMSQWLKEIGFEEIQILKKEDPQDVFSDIYCVKK